MKKENPIQYAKKMAKSKPNSVAYFENFKKYCIANNWTQSSVNGVSVLDEDFSKIVSKEAKEQGKMLCTK